MNDSGIWPSLPLEAWRPTIDTLQRWTQIVGKIRLSLTPWQNHAWHAALYVTSDGLTTSPIAWDDRTFEIAFDFLRHEVGVRCSDGTGRRLELRPRTVADFRRELFARLAELGIRPKIFDRPNELLDDAPFSSDELHREYDADAVHRFFLALAEADGILKDFRSRFSGKSSPVHFFWGSFDLTVTRFSGRRAPAHPGGFPHLPDRITREAYSHEEMSCGFWPGNDATPFPAFYAYAYPSLPAFASAPIAPPAASFRPEAGEFILPYDAVRTAADPRNAVLDFCQSAYEAAAGSLGWDRAALDAEFPPEGPR